MRRRTAKGSDPLGLVGWVFADLLLGLAVVFLATQPGDPAAADAAKTTTTTTATTTTTTTLPPGVDANFACFRLQTDPALLTGAAGANRDRQVNELVEDVRQALKVASLEGRQAGIVLTFGVAQTPGEGKSIADAFNRLVLPAIPEMSGRSAARPFWDGGPRAGIGRGSVQVNLYPLTDGVHPPLPPAPSC